MTAMLSSVAAGAGEIVGTLATLVRAGVLAPLRPDRYVRMAAAVREAARTLFG